MSKNSAPNVNYNEQNKNIQEGGGKKRKKKRRRKKKNKNNKDNLQKIKDEDKINNNEIVSEEENKELKISINNVENDISKEKKNEEFNKSSDEEKEKSENEENKKEENEKNVLIKKNQNKNYVNESSINKNANKPKGLVNFGLNCYMNSLLQCLFFIKELREEFINKKDEYNNDQKVCKVFAEVMYGLQCDDNKDCYEAKEFKKIMGEKNNLFKGRKPADVKDLLINLIDAFMNELSKDDYNESMHDNPNLPNKIKMFQEVENEIDKNIIINKLFLGYYETEYQCPNNKNTYIYSFQYQTFLLFELLLVKNKYKIDNFSIYTCFNYYFMNDKDSTFFCDKCNETHKNSQKDKIYKLPEILIIILDRGLDKIIKDEIKVQKKLDLSSYLDESCIEEKKKSSYNLISVITHSGASSSKGHYTNCCYVDKNKLYFFNDSIVEEVSEEEIFDDEPYILFYRRNADNFNFEESKNLKENKINLDNNEKKVYKEVKEVKVEKDLLMNRRNENKNKYNCNDNNNSKKNGKNQNNKNKKKNKKKKKK